MPSLPLSQNTLSSRNSSISRPQSLCTVVFRSFVIHSGPPACISAGMRIIDCASLLDNLSATWVHAPTAKLRCRGAGVARRRRAISSGVALCAAPADSKKVYQRVCIRGIAHIFGVLGRWRRHQFLQVRVDARSRSRRVPMLLLLHRHDLVEPVLVLHSDVPAPQGFLIRLMAGTVLETSLSTAATAPVASSVLLGLVLAASAVVASF